MTERPTPEQIARSCIGEAGHGADWVLRELERHGYVIVHPDDVPEMVPTPDDQRTATGWNACRRRIFEEATDD